jgi:hypothetical protein
MRGDATWPWWTKYAVTCVVLNWLSIGLFLAHAWPPIRQKGRLSGCANNLRQLWTMQGNYMAQFG